MRAVLDTNVFVSAFVVHGGKAERAFLLGQRRRVDLFTSVAILTETARTLRVKFDQDEEDIKHALRLISRASTVVRRSEEHTSELQSQSNLVCRLLLEKKKKNSTAHSKHRATSGIRDH